MPVALVSMLAISVPLLDGPPAAMEVMVGEADKLVEGVKLFGDRDYTAGPVPETLNGQAFVRGSLPNGITAICRTAGRVLLITPARELNPDSREEELVDQGFERVDQAIWLLFGTGSANRCVLFQKTMAAGERLQCGKWAILVATLAKVNPNLRREYTPARTSMITNQPVEENGRPVLWHAARRPQVDVAWLYQPETEWTYSHHAHLTWFQGRFHAIWSNGREHEDQPGQRVLWSTSADFEHWTTPHVLGEPGLMADGTERVLTAGGWHQFDGTLVAYYGDYGPHKETTRLMALTTTDGEQWSQPMDVGIPVCPNHGPQRTASGRLILTGNISFPYTDDPRGLSGWKMSGIYPPSMNTTPDDPAAFWPVAAGQKWPAALCEGAFYQTDDGVLHMLLRATGPGFRYRLWVSESTDNGASWSEPAETAFSDCNAKFHLGRLPDSRFYYVGNPLAGPRLPLVCSTSRDGLTFDHHWVLGDEATKPRRPGRAKGGEYGYPHTLLHDGSLYVIISRQKEAVCVLRVGLDQLAE